MGLSAEATGFLLVVGAGLSTGIGAGVVYSKNLIQLTSKSILAAALGLSSGVMLYVSFVEIFRKSVDSFAEKYAEKTAFLYATLCFFGGVIIMKVLNFVVHLVDPSHMTCNELDMELVEELVRREKKQHDSAVELCSSDDMENHKTEDEDEDSRFRDASLTSSRKKPNKEKEGEGDVSHSIEFEFEREERIEKKSKALDGRLEKMGLMTAVAIALHNFPEGLATFVATINDTSVGVSLAIAIAIHNIPEGLCVSIPIYYSSGQRHKAFWWGFLSGFSEILGAGLGWIVLKDRLTADVYGSLFGLVAGMMVSICLYELIPTAMRYDRMDNYTSNFTVIGMAVMAISLVAFMY